MNEFCPSCTRPLATAGTLRHRVGAIVFCGHGCMVRWFEDPRHDRRRENRSVAINRRVTRR
jgi:hypothetical protein